MIKKLLPPISLEILQYNIIALGVIGTLAHPFYWYIWNYIYPQDYDLWTLRFSSSLFCATFLFRNYWPTFLKKHFPTIWFLCVCHTLPFLFTTHLILNQWNNITLICEAGMFFMVAILLPNLLLITLNLFLGFVCAILYCYFAAPHTLVLPPHYMNYILPFFFAYITGFIISYSNILGAVAMEKNRRSKIFRAIAGSIVHEIRNPLNFIRSSSTNLQEFIPDKLDNELKKLKKDEIVTILKTEQDEIKEYKKTLEQTLNLANEIIDMTLAHLNSKELLEDDFIYLDSQTSIENTIKLYGYKNKEEKEKITLDASLKDSFTFKADNAPFKYIIFNLVKNSLFYLKDYPDATVTIGCEQNQSHTINKVTKNYNVIYVHDTGPGIPKEAMGNIFESFYTYGKKEGTGLGLSFCKRTMLDFGGDIICESEFGNGQNGWTKFSLLFPVIAPKDLEPKSAKKDKAKILLVDDQEINLKITKRRIEESLPDIHCDTALSGEEGIAALQKKDYQLVLLDIQMPEMDGFITAEEIRKFNQDIPIIAFTSLNHTEFVTQIHKYPDAQKLMQNFSYHLNKSAPGNILFRTITKWMIHKDQLSYLGKKNDYIQVLQNKKILLADDQEMNLLIAKKRLEKHGMVVDTVRSGKELLQHYKNSLDKKTKQSAYDMIITDINMPPFNGDEATLEIRKIEQDNQVLHRNKMPIIAISGNGDKDDIRHFLASQMTDYFIKGDDPKILTRIVANYLKNIGNYEYGADCHRIAVQRDESQETFESSTIININKVKDIATTHEEMCEILNIFLKNGDVIIAEIKSKKDIAGLYDSVHALKGISGNIGANELFSYSSQVCDDLKQERFPDDENWVEKIVAIYGVTKEKVRGFLGER